MRIKNIGIDTTLVQSAIIASFVALLYLAIYKVIKWLDYKWGERFLKEGQYGHWWIIVAGVFVTAFVIATVVGIALFRWLYRAKHSFASECALIDLCVYIALQVLGEGLSVDFYNKALAGIGLRFIAPALAWAAMLWFAIGLVRYFRAEGFGNAGRSSGTFNPIQVNRFAS